MVDGESSNGTRDLAAAFARRHRGVRVFANPRRLSSAGRNIGVRNARGDLIVVINGHCDLENDRYLADLAEAFDRSGADCVGRPQPLNVAAASPLQRTIAAARASALGHHPASFIYSAQEGFVPAKSVAVAYRREVFDVVGPFDETFDACEDVEFNHRLDRAGLRCYFTPRLAIGYQPRSTLGGLVRQLVRYGRGRVRLLKKHPDTLSLSTMVPLVFVVGLIAGPLACVMAPRLTAVYVGTLIVYAAIVLTVTVRIAFRQSDARLLWRLPLVFATVHLASGTGMLLELSRWSPGLSRLINKYRLSLRERTPLSRRERRH